MTLSLFSGGRGSFSITVLSVVVPRISNLAIYGRLHGHSSSLNVVVLSTGARRVSGMAKLLMKTSSCIAGPFSPDRLVTHISTICHHIRVAENFHGGSSRLSAVILSRFRLGLEGHALSGTGRLVRLARIRFRVVRCFFGGPGTTLDEASVLGRI